MSTASRRIPGLLLGSLLAAAPVARAAAAPLFEDDPALEAYVRRAAHENRELEARSIDIDGREADRAAVRASYLPKVDLDVRSTRTFGNELDLGKLVDPAYAALNRITGKDQPPTDLPLPLPIRLDARIRLSQPLFAPMIPAGDHLAAAGVA